MRLIDGSLKQCNWKCELSKLDQNHWPLLDKLRTTKCMLAHKSYISKIQNSQQMVECMRRSEVGLVFSINFDLFDSPHNFSLSQTHFSDISTDHFQFGNSLVFACSSVWSVLYMTRCLFVLSSFKCLTPTSFICAAISSAQEALVISWSADLSFLNSDIWNIWPFCEKVNSSFLSLFVAAWRLQLVNLTLVHEWQQLQQSVQCTMCSLDSFFSFRSNELRHVVKFHGYIAIKHIVIPARSIERKIEKIGFS